MELHSVENKPLWSCIDEAKRIVSKGYSDQIAYETMIGLLAQLEELHNVKEPTYLPLYANLREKHTSDKFHGYTSSWTAIDEAERLLSQGYYDLNIAHTFINLLSEIDYLRKNPIVPTLSKKEHCSGSSLLTSFVSFISFGFLRKAHDQ